MIAEDHQHPWFLVFISVVGVVASLYIGLDSLRELRKISEDLESQKVADNTEIEFIEVTLSRVFSSMLSVPLYSIWLLFVLTIVLLILSLLVIGGAFPMVTESMANFSAEPFISIFFIIIGPALAIGLLYFGWIFFLQILASLVIAAEAKTRTK